MGDSKGFQLGTIGALTLSVVSSVSIVICNKALMSSLHFIFGGFLLLFIVLFQFRVNFVRNVGLRDTNSNAVPLFVSVANLW